jgi:hypothetical protein
MFEAGPYSFGNLLESLIKNYEKLQNNRDLNRTNPVYKPEGCIYTSMLGDKSEFY